MRKNCLFIISLWVILCGNIKAQTYYKYWDQTYGGNSRDWNAQITKGNTGSLFLIGDSQTGINGNKTEQLCSDTVNNSDIWVLKLDTSGSIIWQKDLGGESDERFPQLISLNNINKELLFGCFTLSDTACDKTEPNRDTIPSITADYWLCLLDSNGNKIWDKTLGGDNHDDYPQIIRLTNNEFIVSGESNSPISGDKTVANYATGNDLWTVKLSAAGSKLWDKVHGGTGVEYLASAIVQPNGTFVLAGTTGSDISGDVSESNRGVTDYWMIKIDNAGNKIWDKRYGGSAGERCTHASPTPDNGYILCGYSLSPISGEVTEAPKGLQDYWIIKTDSLGNKQWDKRYGGNNGSFATWIEPFSNGGYWLAGYTNSDNVIDVSEPSYGGSDYWILQIDSTGNKLWDKRYGGSENEFSTSFSILSDSSIIMCGYSDSGSSAVKTAPNRGWWDYWLVKFKYSIPVGIDELTISKNSISVYPNPGNGNFTISLNSKTNKTGDVFVFDIIGNVVYKKQQVSLNNLSVDIRNSNRGVYYLRVKIGGGVFTEKIIKIY